MLRSLNIYNVRIRPIIGITRLTFAVCLVCVSLLYACTTDSLSERVAEPCDIRSSSLDYSSDIAPVIEQTCSYSSNCHLNASYGIYLQYEDLIPDIESGTFRDRVIERRTDPIIGMPPNYAPDDRARDLDSVQIALITCWLENGYPE